MVTLRSRWANKPWKPEPGSKFGGYTYTLEGVRHTLTERELYAAERIGSQTHTEYAMERVDHPPLTIGVEFFDKRPGARYVHEGHYEMGSKRWTEHDEQELMRMHECGATWGEIAAALNRTPLGVYHRYRLLYI